MTNLLEATLTFIDSKGRSIAYPVQGQFFKIVLKVMNSSDSTISGFFPSEAYLSHYSNKNVMQGVSFTSNGVHTIRPGEFVQFESTNFRTFYKNLCTLNIKTISDNPVYIVITTPIEKNLTPSKNNSIFAQCFIQDKDEEQNRKLALSNTLLSFFSCIASIIAVIISLSNNN